MKMKLICECGTVNDDDAKYCKECGKGRDCVSSEVTKLAELAKLKTCRCARCGNETADGWMCNKCKNIYAGPLSIPEELVIRY